MAYWDSRNEDEKVGFSEDTFQVNTCTSSSQYDPLNPFSEINEPKRWHSRNSVNSNESDWDVFSGIVSPIKRNAASDYLQVGRRDAETFDPFVRDKSPLRNIGRSQSTPRHPFDHGDSYDLGSRKVRFSKSTGPLSSHRPMCQTTFSDNYFGSQGLRGQTGFPPSESLVNDDRYSTFPKEMSSLNFDRQYPLRSVADTSYIQDQHSIGPTFHPTGQQSFTPSVVSSSAGFQQSYPATANFQNVYSDSYPLSFKTFFRNEVFLVYELQSQFSKLSFRSLILLYFSTSKKKL